MADNARKRGVGAGATDPALNEDPSSIKSRGFEYHSPLEQTIVDLSTPQNIVIGAVSDGTAPSISEPRSSVVEKSMLAGSDAGSKAGAKAGAREGALAGAKAGARAGRKLDPTDESGDGRKDGARAGAIAGARAGALAGAIAGKTAGDDAGREIGGEEGAKAGAKAGEEAGAQAGSQAGGEAGAKAGAVAGVTARSKAKSAACEAHATKKIKSVSRDLKPRSIRTLAVGIAGDVIVADKTIDATLHKAAAKSSPKPTSSLDVAERSVALTVASGGSDESLNTKDGSRAVLESKSAQPSKVSRNINIIAPGKATTTNKEDTVARRGLWWWLSRVVPILLLLLLLLLGRRYGRTTSQDHTDSLPTGASMTKKKTGLSGSWLGRTSPDGGNPQSIDNTGASTFPRFGFHRAVQRVKAAVVGGTSGAMSTKEQAKLRQDAEEAERKRREEDRKRFTKQAEEAKRKREVELKRKKEAEAAEKLRLKEQEEQKRREEEKAKEQQRLREEAATRRKKQLEEQKRRQEEEAVERRRVAAEKQRQLEAEAAAAAAAEKKRQEEAAAVAAEKNRLEAEKEAEKKRLEEEKERESREEAAALRAAEEKKRKEEEAAAAKRKAAASAAAAAAAAEKLRMEREAEQERQRVEAEAVAKRQRELEEEALRLEKEAAEKARVEEERRKAEEKAMSTNNTGRGGAVQRNKASKTALKAQSPPQRQLLRNPLLGVAKLVDGIKGRFIEVMNDANPVFSVLGGWLTGKPVDIPLFGSAWTDMTGRNETKLSYQLLLDIARRFPHRMVATRVLAKVGMNLVGSRVGILWSLRQIFLH